MTFEGDEMAALRETASKILLVVLWLHVPIAVIVGMVLHADWLIPAAFMAAMALAATCHGTFPGTAPRPA